MQSLQKIHGAQASSVSKDTRRRVGCAVNLKPLYQMLFLTNDKQQRVFVDEVAEVDFREVKEHLSRGESVFITCRPGQKLVTRKTDVTCVRVRQDRP